MANRNNNNAGNNNSITNIIRNGNASNNNNNISNLVSNTNVNKKVQAGNKVNNATEQLIENVGAAIRSSRRGYLAMQKAWDDSPTTIKVANIVLSLGLTYFFTYKYYYLSLSILFFFISWTCIRLMSPFGSVLYLISYLAAIFQIRNTRNEAIGTPFEITDIDKNGKPLLCTGDTGFMIKNEEIPEDVNGGYFTYDFWIYVTGINNIKDNPDYENTWRNYRLTQWKSVMYRGSVMTDETDVNGLLQFPGFWLTPKSNKFVIVFQQPGIPVERFEIDDFPLNAWVNITAVMKTKSISIYVNGLFEQSFTLNQSIRNMNGNNIYIARDGPMADKSLDPDEPVKLGFPGFIGEFVYHNFAMTPEQIALSYKYYKEIVMKYQQKTLDANEYKVSALIGS